MVTFLNVKGDWRLRAAFFEALPICVKRKRNDVKSLLEQVGIPKLWDFMRKILTSGSPWFPRPGRHSSNRVHRSAHRNVSSGSFGRSRSSRWFDPVPGSPGNFFYNNFHFYHTFSKIPFFYFNAFFRILGFVWPSSMSLFFWMPSGRWSMCIPSYCLSSSPT